MKIYTVIIIIYFLIACFVVDAYAQQDWTHKVRICGNPLSYQEIDSIIKKADDSFVYGIEVDNDITGRYESFLDPSEKLEAIRMITEEAHKINNYTFVYIAGLECITADADNKDHTFYKDHPDWVQRDINGRPAMFGAEDAFWIVEGDEDVWISPYAAEWRKIYMQRVREIASTGIDGIYVDIPYWMTHFEGWEDTWASFDDYTVAEFKKLTGLNAKEDIRLGNYGDPGFIKWINFRMKTLTDFMAEIDQNVKAVNPECKTIAEIYPGISEEAVRVGADVFKMYDVVDVIAHEYSEGEYYASDREPYDWYNFIIGMSTFRAFAEDDPTWMLCYSWYDNKNVEPSEAMKSLFASQLFTGTNMWDVKGYVMSSTNDMKTRTDVYSWASHYDDIFYAPRITEEPVSVYFSDFTRNYFSEDFTDSYRGIVNLLIHSHLPLQIVTSRTIENLSPEILILPDVKCISENEAGSIKKMSRNGTKFIITGEFAEYNENREKLDSSELGSNLSWLRQYFSEPSSGNYKIVKNNPGKKYTAAMKEELNNYFRSNGELTEMSSVRDQFLSEITGFTSFDPDIKIDAPIDLIAAYASNEEYLYLYLTNVRALAVAYDMPVRTLNDVKITCPAAVAGGEVYMLPFLGDKEKIKTRVTGKKISFTVPELGRGAVIMIKRK